MYQSKEEILNNLCSSHNVEPKWLDKLGDLKSFINKAMDIWGDQQVRLNSEWISVKNRLPTEPYPSGYIVSRSDGSVHFNYYFFDAKTFSFRTSADTAEVTHWMPLPSPPQV